MCSGIKTLVSVRVLDNIHSRLNTSYRTKEEKMKQKQKKNENENNNRNTHSLLCL